MRVLVVDDYADAVAFLSSLCRHLGCECEVAYDGQQAIARAGEFRPDLLLLDIGMPDMDGFEVAARLRASGMSQMKIYTVSGYKNDVERRKACGIDGHIMKPVQIADLKQVLCC